MRNTHTQKWNYAEEIGCIASAIFGIILFILNILKIIPEKNLVVQIIIAYGFIIGPTFAIIGIAGFIDAIKRNKAR